CYGCGAVAFQCASVGAPHLRDRTYWVADADHARLEGRQRAEERAIERAVGAGGVAGRLADADRYRQHPAPVIRFPNSQHHAQSRCTPGSERPGPTNGYWSAVDWIACRDGKWR